MERNEDKSVDNLVDEVLQAEKSSGIATASEESNLTQGLSVTDILDSLDPKTGQEEIGITEILKEEAIQKEIEAPKKEVIQQAPEEPKKSLKKQAKEKAKLEDLPPLAEVKLGKKDEESEKQKQEFFETHHMTQSIYGNQEHKRVINIDKKIDENFMTFFGQEGDDLDLKTAAKPETKEEVVVEEKEAVAKKEEATTLQEDVQSARERKQQEYLLLKEKRKPLVKRFQLSSRHDPTVSEIQLTEEQEIEKKKQEQEIKREKEPASQIKEAVETEEINLEKTKVILQNPEEESKEKEPEEIPLQEEFVSYEEVPQVRAFIERQKAGLKSRGVITLLLAAFSFLISFGAALDIPLPNAINAITNPAIVVYILLAVAGVGFVIHFESLFYSFINIFKKAADSDSLLAVASLFQLIAFIAFAVSPADLTNLTISLPILLFSLALHSFTKAGAIDRVLKNFDIISDEKKVKYSISEIVNDTLNAQVCAKFKKRDFLSVAKQRQHIIKDFVKTSFAYDYYDELAGKLSVFAILVTLLGGTVVFLVTRNLFTGIGSTAIIATLLNPLCGICTINVGLSKMSEGLNNKDAVLPSYETLTRLEEVDCMVVDDTFFFDKESVSIQGIKTFSNSRIDKIIVYLASVFEKNNSPLTDMFLSVIEYNRSFLVDVEELKYENAMGYSAFIENKVVLIGNRDMMINHSIPVLKESTEQKFSTGNKSILYVSVDNKPAAIFVLNYEAKPSSIWYMETLAAYDVKLSVNVTDPCVTAQKIADVYQYDVQNITLLNKEIEREVHNDKNLSNTNNTFVFDGNSQMYVDGVLLGKMGGSLLRNGVIAQIVLCVLSVVVFLASVFLGNLSFFNVVFIGLFQVVGLVASLVPSFSKKIIIPS